MNLELQASSITTLVCSNSVGNIDVLVTGGTEPYVFDWEFIEDQLDNDGNLISEGVNLPSNTGVINSIGDLTGGIYNLTITDNNGCTFSFSDTINIGPTSINFELEESSFTEKT